MACQKKDFVTWCGGRLPMKAFLNLLNLDHRKLFQHHQRQVWKKLGIRLESNKEVVLMPPKTENQNVAVVDLFVPKFMHCRISDFSPSRKCWISKSFVNRWFLRISKNCLVELYFIELYFIKPYFIEPS